MEIAEGNKLIAEFMNVQLMDGNMDYYIFSRSYPAVIDGINKKNKTIRLHASEMLYNTSWDWLMPVVEKIESLGYHC